MSSQLEHEDGDPYNCAKYNNNLYKKGREWKTKCNREWGALCADAQTAITDDHSERRTLLVGCQPCVSASAIDLGVEVEERACKGYRSYCIDVSCLKRNHAEIPGEPARMPTWFCARARTQCLAQGVF